MADTKPTPIVIETAKVAELGTVIHAFLRTEATEVSLHGERIKFFPNEHGHVIGATKSAEAVERLCGEISEAYVLYEEGQDPAALIDAKQAAEDAKRAQALEAARAKGFIIAGDNGEVNLALMTDAELKKFVKDNGVTGIPPAAKGDTLRAAIVKTLTDGQE